MICEPSRERDGRDGLRASVGGNLPPRAGCAWRKWRTALVGTLLAAGVWLGAVLCQQPAVAPAELPLLSLGGHEWVVTNDYETSVGGVGVWIGKGFVTDLASIPSTAAAALGIRRDSDTIRRAALVHDALYAAERVSKDEADGILFRACLEDGMVRDKAEAVHRAVALYGFTAWDRHTTETVRAAREFVRLKEKP